MTIYQQSDNAPSPLSASMASDALRQTLSRAGEEGPWILASAGVGSLYSRVFSSRNGEDVLGILMIDPLHEDLLSRVGATSRGFMLWLQGAMSPLGIERNFGAILKGWSSADRVWGRASYLSGKRIFAKLQESLMAGLSKREVESSRVIQRKDVPLVVISSGEQMRRDNEWEDKVGSARSTQSRGFLVHSPPYFLGLLADWINVKQQRDLSHLTGNLEDWDVVDDAPHQVWQTLKGREVMERRLRKLAKL